MSASILVFSATCQASDVVGAFVRAADTGNGVVTTTCYQPYVAIGVIVSKQSSTTCTVQTYGLCSGIYHNLVSNSRYLVGPSGQPVSGVNLPADARYVQGVGFCVRADTLFLQPSGFFFQRDVQQTAPGPLSLQIGSGAPVDGQQEQLQDLYVDTDSGQAYFTPAQSSTASNVYIGSGPPTQGNMGAPQDVYYDEDAQTLYVQNTAQGAASSLTVGHGAPPGASSVAVVAGYFDQQNQTLYPSY